MNRGCMARMRWRADKGSLKGEQGAVLTQPGRFGAQFALVRGTMLFLTSISKILMTTSAVACVALMAVPGVLWLVDQFWVAQPALEDWD